MNSIALQTISQFERNIHLKSLPYSHMNHNHNKDLLHNKDQVNNNMDRKFSSKKQKNSNKLVLGIKKGKAKNNRFPISANSNQNKSLTSYTSNQNLKKRKKNQ